MPERISVAIDGKDFGNWNSLEVRLAIDSYSTVSFTAPFEAERKAFRETFRPFAFKPLAVKLDGSPLFTGTLVGVHPKVDATARTAEVTGYSLPAVLEDCTAPGGAFPLEFKKQGLRAIYETLLGLFGLLVDVRADEGATFDVVKLEVDTKINSFLVELAKQRNLVLASTPAGKLLCWQSVPAGRPVAVLRDDSSPVTAISATFSPQDYYSEITGFASSKRGRKGTPATARNPFLTSVVRPLSFNLDDTENADAPEAVRAKLGRMFANMASFAVDVATWRDPKGKLWQPNTTVKVLAPNAMIYRESEFLVRAVNLFQDAEKESASLELVLPGAFSGQVPEVLPWVE